MDAITAIGSAWNDAVQEDNVVIPFLDRHIPVANTRQRLLKINQFMVVCREHCTGSVDTMKMLDNRPC